MAIEREAGLQHLVCDCGSSQRRTYERDEFDVMIADAKGDGWIISRAGGEWQHTCPDCAAQPRRQARLL